MTGLTKNGMGFATVFEELFHAVQDDFYQSTTRNTFSNEYEAKTALIVSAYQENNLGLLDDDVLKGMDTNDMNIIAKSLLGENVDKTKLNQAFGNLKTSLSNVYNRLEDKTLVAEPLKYLKSILKDGEQ